MKLATNALNVFVITKLKLRPQKKGVPYYDFMYLATLARDTLFLFILGSVIIKLCGIILFWATGKPHTAFATYSAQPRAYGMPPSSKPVETQIPGLWGNGALPQQGGARQQ